MSLASHTTFPSGGRLGRRPRAWPRLLLSSIFTVGFAAVLVGLVALGTHRSKSVDSSSAARVSSASPKKIEKKVTNQTVEPVARQTPAAGAASASAAVIEAPTSAPSSFAPSSSLAPSDDSATQQNMAATQTSAPPLPEAGAQADFAPIVPHAVKTVPVGKSSAAQPASEPSAANSNATPAENEAPAISSRQAAQNGPPAASDPSQEDQPVAGFDQSQAQQSPAQSEATPPASPVSPPAEDADAAPQTVASAEEPAEAGAAAKQAAAGGAFAVYLAASATEAEARALLAPTETKYAAALRGARLSYHRMRVNGATVYRLRVGRLVQAAATSLCDKLRAAAATCDVGPE
jgi:SPOR domain